MRRATLAAAIVGLTQWLAPLTATAAPQVSVAYGDAPAGDAALGSCARHPGQIAGA